MMNNHLRRSMAALLAALLMLTGTLAGCGKEDETEQVSLRTMSIMGDDDTREVYRALLEEYSAAYPHVYHTGTIAEADNAYKLDATFESTYTGSKYPHAVYYYTNTGIEELTDQFVSVEEIRKSYPDFAAGVTEAALDSVRAKDGEAYCVPFGGSWTAMAVNTGLLEKYSLNPPETWQDLIVAAGILSARGQKAIANPPDDSAALLELICLSAAGERAMDAILDEEAPLKRESHQEDWLTVFRLYEELCGINSFPTAVVTEELTAALEQLAQVEAAKAALSSAVSASDVSDSDAPTVIVSPTDMTADIPVQTTPVDAFELFNSGQAAMMIVESDDLDRITIEGFTVVLFPSCGQDGQRLLAGSYDAGWLITRRAFSDNSVRDAVVAFVDTMVSGSASDRFVEMGWLPSITSDGDVPAGLYGMAGEAECLMESRRTPASSVRFAELEQIASALSMDIITPEQAVELASDRSLKLTDVIPKPPQTIPAAPSQPEVSGTDAVSGSDLS